ncbi:MAG: class I SAM-dependent methyltransferase [Candidatus Eisenbacteria bacterium]
MSDAPPRFDPAEWERLQPRGLADDAPPAGVPPGRIPNRTYGLRRGFELALQACLELRPTSSRWLDVGCGRGQLAESLRNRGHFAVGLDADEAMLRPGPLDRGDSLVRTGTERSMSRLDHVCALAEPTPFAPRSFDGIVAVSLLGCLIDPGELFREAARLLRPSGVLVFTHTNASSRLLAMSRALNGRRPGRPRTGAIHLHAGDAIETALASSGFRIVDRWPYNFTVDLIRWSIPTETMARGYERHLQEARAHPGDASSPEPWARNLLVIAEAPEVRRSSPETE